MTRDITKIQNRIHVLTCLVTLAYGCALQKPLNTQDIVGHYSVPTKFHPTTLSLNQDGSFEYKHTYQLGSSIDYTWSSGTWSIQDGNKLFLRSTIQPHEEKINTHQLTITGEPGVDSTRIKLLTDMGETIPFVTILLTEDGEVVTGCTTKFSGECSLPTVNADSVDISHPGYKKIELPYEKVEGLNCVIEMSYFPDKYRFFSNQEFSIRGKKILFNNFWPMFGDSKNIRKRFFKEAQRAPTSPKKTWGTNR